LSRFGQFHAQLLSLIEPYGATNPMIWQQMVGFARLWYSNLKFAENFLASLF
jgi:hypothetical protein